MKYRKKPVIVDAVQFRIGDPLPDGVVMWPDLYNEEARVPVIHTTEGRRFVQVQDGDWIIRGIKGEFYLCKPDIFEATYEPAE